MGSTVDLDAECVSKPLPERSRVRFNARHAVGVTGGKWSDTSDCGIAC